MSSCVLLNEFLAQNRLAPVTQTAPVSRQCSVCPVAKRPSAAPWQPERGQMRPRPWDRSGNASKQTSAQTRPWAPRPLGQKGRAFPRCHRPCLVLARWSTRRLAGCRASGYPEQCVCHALDRMEPGNLCFCAQAKLRTSGPRRKLCSGRASGHGS